MERAEPDLAIIVQHKDYDKPRLGGDPWELDQRVKTTFVRIRDQYNVDNSPGDPKSLGFFDCEEEEDYGDLVCTIIWPRDEGENGREIHAAGMAIPIVTVKEQDDRTTFGFAEDGESGGGGGGGLGGVTTRQFAAAATVGEDDQIVARAIYEVEQGVWHDDERLADAIMDRPIHEGTGEPLIPRPPAGQHGIMLSAVDERKQIELWHRTDPRLVVPRRHGEIDHSEFVVDVTEDDEIDMERQAFLADHMVVGYGDDWQPAWLLTDGIDGRGYGLCVGRPEKGGTASAQASSVVVGAPPADVVNVYASHERGGFIHPGHNDDSRRIATDPDGNHVQPAYIWTDAEYYMEGFGGRRAGKLWGFRREDWQPGGRFDHVTEPEIRFDASTRSFRLWDTTMVGAAPPPFKPPADEPPPHIPNEEEVPTSGGG